MKSKDTLYWIWLSLALSPGRDTLAKLMVEFSSAKQGFSIMIGHVTSM